MVGFDTILNVYREKGKPTMNRTTRWTITLAAVLMVIGLADANPALAQSKEKIRRAADFLNATKRGKEMLSILHFGGTYVDHNVTEVFRVTDRDGNDMPGRLALKVVFDWTTLFGDNSTTAVVFFNELGDPYEIQCKPADSTSIGSPPFEIAKGTLQVVGNLLLAVFGDKMSATEKADFQKAIDNQDPAQLLINSMKIEKRLGL